MIFYNYCYWTINLIGFLMANGKSFSVGRVEKWFSYRANAHRHAKSHKLKRTRLKFFDRHSDWCVRDYYYMHTLFFMIKMNVNFSLTNRVLLLKMRFLPSWLVSVALFVCLFFLSLFLFWRKNHYGPMFNWPLTQCAGRAMIIQSLWSPHDKLDFSKLSGGLWANWRCQAISKSIYNHSFKHCLAFNTNLTRDNLWNASVYVYPLDNPAWSVFEDDKMIDSTICSQSLGALLAQQEERKSLNSLPSRFHFSL